MARSKQPNPAQLPIFDDSYYQSSSPSKRALYESILHKQEELRVGQLDYDRYRPVKKKYEEAAQVKHSRFARIDGELVSVPVAQAVVKFLNNWTRRRSQLVWELEELKKAIEK